MVANLEEKLAPKVRQKPMEENQQGSQRNLDGGTTGGNRDLQEEAVVGEGSKTSTATGAETLSSTTTKADETLPSMGETALVNEATSLLRSLRAEASERLQPNDQVSVLLGGGATHSLRICHSEKDWQSPSEIEVSLAEGSKAMRQCRVSRQGRADLPVQLVQGCPTVEYEVGSS